MVDVSRKRIAKFLVTGTSGYVGSQIKEFLINKGCHLSEAVHGNPKNLDTFKFSLGDVLDPRAFDNVTTLIHCAYDIKAVTWEDIYKKNVCGSRLLFRQAQDCGVEMIILISTISAFENTQSLYGKAKLLIEEEVLNIGGAVVRPGLVYGDHPGGMVGKLNASLTRSTLIPIVGRHQMMYLCHQNDLSALIYLISTDKNLDTSKPIVAASSEGYRFIDFLRILSNSLEKRHIFVPIPWQIIWMTLKCFELFGLKLGYKSDSIVNLMHVNLKLDFGPTLKTNNKFRPYRSTP